MVRLMKCSVLVGPKIFPLILLALLGGLLVPASGIMRSQEGNGPHPSAATLAGCQMSCGNLTFNYPFGTGGSHCFRAPDFELTCNETVHPPRLLLRDGITQVANNIVTTDTGSTYEGDDDIDIDIALTYTIPMRHGIDVYNVSWVSPAKSFALSYASLNVTGCNFEVYFYDRDTNTTSWVCTLTCPAGEIMETMAIQNCNGTGCCSVYLGTTIRSFALNFERHNNGNVDAWSNRSSLWDSIKVTTNQAELSWHIMDQQKCAGAKENNTNYACVGTNTRCIDSKEAFDFGYLCKCYPGYVGNPYLLNGCLRDKGYNPAPQKDNCSRLCGNINVPFPFGIEEGCSARKEFFLKCTNMTTSTLVLDNYFLVKDIDVQEGLIKFTELDKDERSVYPSIFIESGEPISMKWVAANLTCPEAQSNKSGYACVSTNSKCVAVNSSDTYVGYQCKCLDGFRGNPYVLINGCQDIDECTENRCSVNAICQNTLGSFKCICPPRYPKGTPYNGTCEPDLALSFKDKLAIGICVSVLTGLILFLGKEWIKHKQRIARQEHIRKINECFEHNGGQLLKDMMKVESNISFKLYGREEVELATNNFDDSAIIGEGGQGTVYIGHNLDPDNNPVAIKRCKGFNESRRLDFGKELLILSRVNHENIVKLLGCSLQFDVPVLVYEYVPNRTLHYLIHSHANKDVRALDIRLKIATKSAEALAYLHSLNHPILHGDVKSANILLGPDLSAKVSDFGCSMITSAVENVQVVKGTIGYLDPEYLLKLELTDKSDVYSFGVILLELLTRMVVISKEKECLASVFQEALKKGKQDELLDPEIIVDDQDNMDVVHQIAELAARCLVMPAEHRPTMREVAEELGLLEGVVQQRPRVPFHSDRLLIVPERSIITNTSEFYSVGQTMDYDILKKKAWMSIEFAR